MTSEFSLTHETSPPADVQLMNRISMNPRSSRREFLANASVLSTAGMIGSSLPLTLRAASYFEDQTAPEYSVRIRASTVDIGNKHIVSAVTYNDQFPGPLLRFKEGSKQQSRSTTTPTRRNNCTGMDNSFRRKWMERRRKGRPLSPRTECAASRSGRSRRAFASITRTTGPGRTCTPDNTAVRLDLCTSNQNTTRESTTGRCFSF